MAKTKKDKQKILVVGSYNVGLSCKTNRIPVWGETLMVDNYTESNGGKGSNQAVAASRLGGNVSFISSIGQDQFGDAGINMLKKEKIDITGITRSNTHTGVGFILLNNQGENCILVDPGANNFLNSSDIINTQQFEEADLIVFQLENDVKMVESTMKLAKEKGKKTILNPAPGNSDAINLLKYADIINPNETELLTLNNKDINLKLTTEDCINLAQNLLKQGPESVIVTRGSMGALIVTNNKVKEVPAKKVIPVDTTGAGDAFTGALSVFLSEEKKLETAVELANISAAFAVTKQDVIPGLPTRYELDNFKIELGDVKK